MNPNRIMHSQSMTTLRRTFKSVKVLNNVDTQSMAIFDCKMRIAFKSLKVCNNVSFPMRGVCSHDESSPSPFLHDLRHI